MATDNNTGTMNGISVNDLKAITLKFANKMKAIDKDMDSELFANVCVAYAMRQFGSAAVKEMLSDDETFNESFSLMHRIYTQTEYMDPIKETIGHMRDVAAGVDEPEYGMPQDIEDIDDDIDDDEDDHEPAVSREAVIKLKASIEKMEEAISSLKRVLRELEE